MPDQRSHTDHSEVAAPGRDLLEGVTAILRSPELASLVSAVVEGRPATWPTVAHVAITYAETNKTKEENNVQ